MIKVAMIGIGGMGKTHIQNLSLMQDVTITDICDKNPQAKDAAETIGAAFYEDIDAMLQSTVATAVIICTPTFLHYQQIRAALLAGKHCIVEKPLCLTSQHARELYALAGSVQRNIYVGQVIRFWEEYQFASDLVADQRYGRVIDASFHRLTAQPTWSAGNWLFDKEKSGLIPFDLHIHEVDFMVSLFGKPNRLVVQSGGVGTAGCLTDYYRVMYFYDHLTVCAESSWYQSPIPFTQGFRIYFEDALLIYDGTTTMLYRKGASPEQVVFGSATSKVQTSINVVPTNAYYYEMEHFLHCIRNNQPSEKVRMEQVIAVLEIIEELVY